MQNEWFPGVSAKCKAIQLRFRCRGEKNDGRGRRLREEQKKGREGKIKRVRKRETEGERGVRDRR